MIRNLLWILPAGLSLLLGACSMSGPRLPDGVAADSLLTRGLPLDKDKGDSAQSIDLRFKQLDTVVKADEFASELYLLALDNFIEVGQGDERVPDVMVWKGNHLYNRGAFQQAVDVYSRLLETFPNHPQSSEAVQMVAQAYSRMGKEGKAEEWYRRLLEQGSEEARDEARTRIAQSIYKRAQQAEEAGEWEKASGLYRRVATEFPTVDIAASSLFNAGVMREKSKDWLAAVEIYGQFFDAFYESELLPKVLFREAKCWEFQGRFEKAAQRYLNLVKAHPRSPEAELALYNAGFAFENAKQPDLAAGSFEKYALAFPDKDDAPNTLFRAAELHGELKNWDKVSELQKVFLRRYSADKTRVIQALCLGGTAYFKQERYEESMAAMKKALEHFSRLQDPDPTSRYYAAQAQHTIGELRMTQMRAVQLKGSPAHFQRSLKAKTTTLKLAVEEFVKVLDFKVADWALRAAFSLGEVFEEYGIAVYTSIDRNARGVRELLDKEEEATASLGASMEKAMQQYFQAALLARQHNMNNAYVEEARLKVARLPYRAGKAYMKLVSLIPEVISADRSSREKEIAGRLEQLQRMGPFQEKAIDYFRWLVEADEQLGLKASETDSARHEVVRLTLDLGSNYMALTELARGAPIPSSFQPHEVFFYKVKLLEEGVAEYELKGMQHFIQGLKTSQKLLGESDPILDSLRQALGRAMYIQSRCYDLLAAEALMNPPIPPGASDEQRDVYITKFESIGFRLQDKALEGFRQVVARAEQGFITSNWGELAYGRLYQIEPREWAKMVESDSIVAVWPGQNWTAATQRPGEGWTREGQKWEPVKPGLVKSLPYPAMVRDQYRFFWNGIPGQSPTVGDRQAPYLPSPEIWAQTSFEPPSSITGMELMVVTPPPWKVMLDGDTLASSESLKGAWFNGHTVALDNLISRFGKRPDSTGRHLLSLWAKSENTTEGFGAWVALIFKIRVQRPVAMFPWSKEPLSEEQLKTLLQRQPHIANFSAEDRLSSTNP